MKAKIIYDMAEKDYRADDTILSKSALDKFISSPLTYWDAYINEDRAPYIQTDAFKVGSAVHTYVLENDKFYFRYAIAPELNKRTNEGKEEWKKFEETNKGKEILSRADLQEVQRMSSSIRQHPVALDLLKNISHAEASVFYNYDGVAMRSRFDAMTDNHKIIDLKTTKDSSADGFARSISNFRYHLQAYLYSYAYNEVFDIWPEFWFVAVEKTRPYHVGVYQLTDSWYDEAALLAGREIEKFKWCRKNNRWPGYNSDRSIILDVPAWMKKRNVA